MVTQWVPLYESNPEVVKSEMATFFDVFPDGTIWSNDINGEGYDVVLLGRAEPVQIDVDALQQRLDRRDHLAVAAVPGGSEIRLGAGPALDLRRPGPDLKDWLRTPRSTRTATCGCNTWPAWA